MTTKTYCELKKRKVDGTLTVIATWEMRSLGGQDPYFAVTCVEYENGKDVGGGAAHDLIDRLFPEKARYTKWHLCAINKGPLHYLANALYWAGKSGFCDSKPGDPTNLEAFKKTIVFGAVESDHMWNLSQETLDQMSADGLKTYLSSRKPALMESFYSDMKDLFGDQFQFEEA